MAVKMTPRQEAFISIYLTRGDTFNSGVLSYAQAFGHELPRDINGKIMTTTKEYNTCGANSSRLMQDSKIREKITTGMIELLNDNAVDERLSYILHKGQEANSIQAIKIANDLKNRITKRIDITTQGRPFGNMTDEELEKLAL